jgi:hypothetical protein
VRKAGDRASLLTKQLLAFSRRQVLNPKVLELNAVVADMDMMLRRLIGEHIDLVSHLAPDLGRVKVDPGQIGQVLLNLAVNARDAMSDGGRLTVETSNVELSADYARTHPGMAAGHYVLLAVSDTGCGMTTAIRERIFDPFFTTKETGKGTGLGLSTVYGIVKQSGGGVGVYSEPGTGTAFKVYLPRIGAPVERAERVPEPLPAVGARRGGTLLLVEDDTALRSFTRDLLVHEGYRVAPRNPASAHGRGDAADERPRPGTPPGGQPARAQDGLHVRLPSQRHRPPRRSGGGPGLRREAFHAASADRQASSRSGRRGRLRSKQIFRSPPFRH